MLSERPSNGSRVSADGTAGRLLHRLDRPDKSERFPLCFAYWYRRCNPQRIKLLWQRSNAFQTFERCHLFCLILSCMADSSCNVTIYFLFMWYMYKLPRVLLRRDSCVFLKLFTEIGGIKKAQGIRNLRNSHGVCL